MPRRFQSQNRVLQIVLPLLIVLLMVYFSLVLSRFVITGKLSTKVYWESPLTNAVLEEQQKQQQGVN